MTKELTDSPVARFCSDLAAVAARSGLSRSRLAGRLNIGKSQLYEILGARITRPPDWERLVEPLLRACAAGDEATISEWRRRHFVLVSVHEELRRQQRGATRRRDAVGALAQVWNVPARNVNFAGRDDLLERLHASLLGESTVAVHALRGMGGVGKTQSAIEYAHRNAASYDVVWWINAEKASLIADQFGELGQELSLPAASDPTMTVRAVHRNLRGRDRWLLIFDNAESVGEIRPFLPSGPGHILITTRREGFRAIGAVVELDVLTRAEAVALIRQRSPASNRTAARRLARRLGDLPLALDQAAAYLDRTGMPIEDYLQLLHQRAMELYGHRGTSEYPHTIATVWSVSIETLRHAHPAAVALLELCAWLAPEPVPLDLFTSHVGLLTGPLSAAAANPLEFTETVAALTGYSLARRSGDAILVHRLIQDVTRHHGDILTSDHPLETVWNLLLAASPDDPWGAPAGWPRYRQIAPHVLAASGHHHSSQSLALPALLSRTGLYLQRQARHAEAIDLHRRAAAGYEQVPGSHHPQFATELGYLGRALCAVGRFAEALPSQERALHIQESLHGSCHASVAVPLNNVGRALMGLDRPAEAIALHQRALSIRESVYGPDHPTVATDLNFIGLALMRLGRYDEALPVHQRALEIRQNARGHDHPDVAAHLSNVAQTLLSMGRYADALPVLQQSLLAQEATYNVDHPAVLAEMTRMQQALEALGRPAEANAIAARAETTLATTGRRRPRRSPDESTADIPCR